MAKQKEAQVDDRTVTALSDQLSCGHVGCCDNSPNRHATAHFHPTAPSFAHP